MGASQVWFLLVALSITGLDAAEPSGEGVDQVWLAPPQRTQTTSDWYPQAIEILAGRVIDLDAKHLQFLSTDDDSDIIVAAERVLWIEPAEVPEGQRTMIALFENGEFGKSLAHLPDVLKARPPVWRQQWLTMMSACAAQFSDRPNIALELVDQLDRRPLPPLVIAWLPIHWDGAPPSQAMLDEASRRIDDDSSLVQVVVASWLLSSPQRQVAIDRLRSLTQNSDRMHVARLAQVLLWTTQPPSKVIESEFKWLAQIESLPMVLQPGPSMALQRKLRTAGQLDSANRLRWSNQLTPINQRWNITNISDRVSQ
jgi:hypothetical protein